jgi:hypothetical protein
MRYRREMRRDRRCGTGQLPQTVFGMASSSIARTSPTYETKRFYKTILWSASAFRLLVASFFFVVCSEFPLELIEDRTKGLA